MFGSKTPEPISLASDGSPVPLQPVYEKGHPSKAAYTSIGDVKHLCPKDYFDLQLSPGYIANIRKGTNYRFSAKGVGIGVTGSKKKDFGNCVPFDDPEIYKFIGFLYANGLMPRPIFKTWLKPLPTCSMFGNSLATGAFDKTVHGKKSKEFADGIISIGSSPYQIIVSILRTSRVRIQCGRFRVWSMS